MDSEGVLMFGLSDCLPVKRHTARGGPDQCLLKSVG